MGLCHEHHTSRRQGLIVAWSGVAIALLFIAAGAIAQTSFIIFLGIIVMIALPITGGRLARIASPAKIDDQYIWLKVGEPFLMSFPERDD